MSNRVQYIHVYVRAIIIDLMYHWQIVVCPLNDHCQIHIAEL